MNWKRFSHDTLVKLFVSLITSLIVIIITQGFFISFKPINDLELKLIDARFKQRGNIFIKDTSKVIILEITQESYDQIPAPDNSWPWPRYLFADLIEKQVTEVNEALKQIRKIKQQEMEKRFKQVHSLENLADDLHDKALVKLYKEKDPIKIIIMKEVYDFLEAITDKCEDVCLVIQDIVLKNA